MLPPFPIMAWLQVHLTLDKATAAAAEELLEQLGALSVTLTDAGDEPQLEPAPGEQPLWSQTIVTGLFPGDTAAALLKIALDKALAAQPLTATITFEELAEQAWERAWLDDFKPMRFGQNLWVVPHGQALPTDAHTAIALRLDPGLAFGTGTHATTALCLAWLDGEVLQGKTLIDYGCGSGILAIAALLLGASAAIGIDHDPQALLASADNAKANGVNDKLELLDHRQPLHEPADVVIANILASVLLELVELLAGLVKPGGRIALSGILAEQAETVRLAYESHFELDPTQQQGDWVLISGTKSVRPRL